MKKQSKKPKMSLIKGLIIVNSVFIVSIIFVLYGYIDSNQVVDELNANQQITNSIASTSLRDAQSLTYDKQSDSYLIPSLRLMLPNEAAGERISYVILENEDTTTVNIKGWDSSDRIARSLKQDSCVFDVALSTSKPDGTSETIVQKDGRVIYMEQNQNDRCQKQYLSSQNGKALLSYLKKSQLF